MNNKIVPKGFSKMFVQLQMELCGCIAEIKNGTDEPNYVLAERLFAELKEEQKKARGNRPGNSPITWDDLRLVLASCLRVCLKELEKAD